MPAYAVRLKPDAVRELGLTTMQLATSLRSFVNGDVATYWTSPDGEQVEVELRLPQAARARTSPSSTTCRSPTRRTARRSRWRASPTSCRSSTRSSSSARTCSAARRSTPAPKGRPSGDVGADVQKIVDETQLPPGYRFDIGGQTRDQAGGVRRRPARARRGGDLHLHRAGVAVRQLPAAARDHGLAAAGADRRDARAAASRARR